MMYLIYEIDTNKLVAFTESLDGALSFSKIKDDKGFVVYDYVKADQEEVWLKYWEDLQKDGIV